MWKLKKLKTKVDGKVHLLGSGEGRGTGGRMAGFDYYILYVCLKICQTSLICAINALIKQTPWEHTLVLYMNLSACTP